MKKFLLVLFVAALFPLTSNAQSSPGYFGIEAGLGMPMSPSAFKSGYNMGFNLGGLYTKPLNDLFSIGGEVNYASYSADLPSGASGGSLSFFTILGTVKVADNYTASQIAPFGRAGIGINFASASDLTVGNTTFKGGSENGLAIILAGGLDFKLSGGNKVSVELGYRVNNTPGTSYNGLSINGEYHFIF